MSLLSPLLSGANLSRKAEGYKYSSAKANLLGEYNEIITKDIIGNARAEYREFFCKQDARCLKEQTEIAKVMQQEKVFGSIKFIEWVEKKFDTCLRVRKRGRPVKIK